MKRTKRNEGGLGVRGQVNRKALIPIWDNTTIGTEVHWYLEDHSVYECFYLNKTLENILIIAQMFYSTRGLGKTRKTLRFLIKGQR